MTQSSKLPLGIQSFANLRQRGYLYVDKTALQQKLIQEGEWYFLARPRRFGKSLTISTLEAMFAGQAELFRGLAAEAWVTAQSKRPFPVLRLDMSAFGEIDSPQKLEQGLTYSLQSFAARCEVTLPGETHCDLLLPLLLQAVCQKHGQSVVLIDEYDNPMLSNLDDHNLLEKIRKQLRSFYMVIKSCQEYIRFLMVTGISKFTKTGIFSALNNLVDISMEEEFAALTGYTQKELEASFDTFIDTAVAQHIMPTRASFLEKIKKYYDGFSFDGKTKVYNPFSILNFFRKYRFSNYWYESGSVTFIESYCKTHKIESPETYHLTKMQAAKMAAREIEQACPESFLLQAGYLTIVEYADDYLILDYPNQEVLSSLSEMYLTAIYPIPHYNDVGTRLWACVRAGLIPDLVAEYNAALASLPYQDFAQCSSTGQPGESFYRSLFLMLLRACGLQAHGEMPTCRGRSDVLIVCPERIVVIEFKLARTTGEIAGKWREGEKQIQASGYLEPYATQKLPISSAVFVIDAQKRQIVADRPRLEQTPD